MSLKSGVQLLFAFLLVTGVMNAQATRTWVSGVGDDANPCSRTAPCKTFAGAISKTAPGGEIDALDPGGFGALTITKSITIDGGGGQVASVLVAGTNGIVVQAGANDVVTLRNVRFDGLRGGGNANAGLNGIRFISGNTLHIENCYIFGFNNNGIDIAMGAAGSVFIENTTSQDNGNWGLSSVNTALVNVYVDRSHFDHNVWGIVSGSFTQMSVAHSEASENTYGGMIAFAANGTASLNISDSVVANNATMGVQAGGSTGASTVRIGGTALFGQPNGLFISSNGNIVSFGNNLNAGSGTPTTVLAPQ